jgi:hypothetical protein
VDLNDCGRLLCAVMLVVHPLHFATYQGLPEADHAPAFACPDDVAGVQAPKLPARFDSEGPGMPVPARLSTASTAVTGGVHVIEPDSARHTVTSGLPPSPRRAGPDGPTASYQHPPPRAGHAPRPPRRPATLRSGRQQSGSSPVRTPGVATEELPRGFDSEGPHQEGEHRDGDVGTAGGSTVFGTARADLGPLVATAHGYATRGLGRFDSESPQSSGEPTDQATQAIDGRAVRQVGGTAYVGAIGHGRADRGRFDSEGPQRDGGHRDGSAGTSGGSTTSVTLEDEVAAIDSLRVEVTGHFDSEGAQRDGEARPGAPSSAAGGGRVVQIGQTVEIDSAMPITVHTGE